MPNKTNIYDEIKRAAAERAEEHNSLNEKLANAQREKEKAVQAAADAIASGKADLYTSAKNAERASDDQIEFYNIQLDKLNKKSLFDDDKAKSEELKRYALEAQADKCKLIADHLKQIRKLLNEIDEEYRIAESTGKILDSNFSMLPDKMIFNGLNGPLMAAMNHVLVKETMNK